MMGYLQRFNLDPMVRKHGLDVFVETGTARGDSLAWAAQLPQFRRLFSCEIEPLLAAGAICRFNADPRVCVFRQESGEFVRMMARSVDGPTLWWLDAHYPGAELGIREYSAGLPEWQAMPLGRELACLRDAGRAADVILIDDLRIYETGAYDDGPLPDDVPGQPTENGADWIREMFAATHDARTLMHDQGYLLLVPKKGMP